jgi:hypothetical protein
MTITAAAETSPWTCTACDQPVVLADARAHFDSCPGGDKPDAPDPVVEPSVRLLGTSDGRDRVAFVTLAGEDQVRVRFRPPGFCAWRCDECGRSRRPACEHSRAVLAELDLESSERRDET